MAREIWKPLIPGYYSISNHGRVRREAPGRGTRPGLIQKLPQRSVSLYIDGQRYSYTPRQVFTSVWSEALWERVRRHVYRYF